MASKAGFNGAGTAAAEAVGALLRTQGGGQVRLRLPISLDADADQQALGLATAAIEAVPLEPVVVSRVAEANSKVATYELLIPAKVAGAVAEARQIASGEDMLLSARGVENGDQRLMVISVTTDYCRSVPYLYRLRATEQSDASSEG